MRGKNKSMKRWPPSIHVKWPMLNTIIQVSAQTPQKLHRSSDCARVQYSFHCSSTHDHYLLSLRLRYVRSSKNSEKRSVKPLQQLVDKYQTGNPVSSTVSAETGRNLTFIGNDIVFPQFLPSVLYTLLPYMLVPIGTWHKRCCQFAWLLWYVVHFVVPLLSCALAL